MGADVSSQAPSDAVGPTRRRVPDPRGWAWVLLLTTAALLFVVGTPVTVSVYAVPVLVGFVTVLAHASMIPLAMRRPVAATSAALVIVAFLMVISRSAGSVWPWGVPWLLIQLTIVFVVGLRTPWKVGVSCWGGSIALSLIVAWLMGGLAVRPADATNLIVFASLSGPVLAVAVALHEWERIRSQLIRERQVSADEFARRTVVEEKARIARELHDVIAHSMSLISVQATSAPYRHPSVDAAVVAEFEEIAASSRQALTEMRHVLSVLRNEDTLTDLAPQPGLADVEALVDQAEKAGLRVSLSWDGERTDLGEVVGLAAYRILQEALSNAIRHAPDSDVAVRCAYTDEGLEIQVKNTAGVAPPRSDAASGLGLVGMRERAHGVGGSVDAGTIDGGGFAVHAVLPYPTTDRQETP